MSRLRYTKPTVMLRKPLIITLIGYHVFGYYESHSLCLIVPMYCSISVEPDLRRLYFERHLCLWTFTISSSLSWISTVSCSSGGRIDCIGTSSPLTSSAACSPAGVLRNRELRVDSAQAAYVAMDHETPGEQSKLYHPAFCTVTFSVQTSKSGFSHKTYLPHYLHPIICTFSRPLWTFPTSMMGVYVQASQP
ncbi:hypothetical protein F5Y14DRAFT_458404 [Nemania sp. NC0429]|nr:hypothetical protein F5Y14DRAFT_458404 [Nemania sp. NC0429]